MRRVVIIAATLIAAPALALAATSAGLRGAQTVAAASASTSAPAPLPTPAPLPPPIKSKAPLAFFATNAQPDAQTVQECRLGCAHNYYFCLASEDAPNCPQNWTSCRADCARNSAPLP